LPEEIGESRDDVFFTGKRYPREMYKGNTKKEARKKEGNNML